MVVGAVSAAPEQEPRRNKGRARGLCSRQTGAHHPPGRRICVLLEPGSLSGPGRPFRGESKGSPCWDPGVVGCSCFLWSAPLLICSPISACMPTQSSLKRDGLSVSCRSGSPPQSRYLSSCLLTPFPPCHSVTGVRTLHRESLTHWASVHFVCSEGTGGTLIPHPLSPLYHLKRPLHQ